jgi:NTE family protein
MSEVRDGLAWPRSFDARYGDGLGLGVSLGGGGIFFVAWQASFLHELLQHGIDLSTADRVIGTSAGSLVASVLEAEHLKRFHRELGLLAEHPKFVAALAPARDLHPSQTRALDSLEQLMDPSAVPEAIATGRRQAAADADELQTLLAS